MTNLVVRHPDGSVELEPGMTLRVGRHEEADLIIHHPDVSRRHARFYWAEGWYVADEGSTNGTYLDGARITEARIGGAAVVALGAPDSSVLLQIEGGLDGDEDAADGAPAGVGVLDEVHGTRLMGR